LLFPPVEGLLRDTGFSNQGYHGFTAEHPVDHFPSEMWGVLVWNAVLLSKPTMAQLS
jgi:hypothetical protein